MWQPIEKKPPYSTPLIIVYRGVVQYFTYVLDGVTDGERVEAWFTPYYFGGNCIPIDEVSHWSLLPEPPTGNN